MQLNVKLPDCGGNAATDEKGNSNSFQVARLDELPSLSVGTVGGTGGASRTIFSHLPKKAGVTMTPPDCSVIAGWERNRRTEKGAGHVQGHRPSSDAKGSRAPPSGFGLSTAEEELRQGPVSLSPEI